MDLLIYRIIILQFFVMTFICDNTIQISCYSCGSQICFNFDGGPFDHHIFPANRSNCNSVGNFPATI